MRVVAVIVACGLICAHAATLQPSSRIAGGSAVSLTEFPFATALLTNSGSGSVYSHRCGGSILTTTAIVSAASCFQSEGVSHPVQWWRARVGSSFSNAGGTVHTVRLITRHPDYSWLQGEHDVAILRVTIALTFVPGLVGAASIAGAAYTLTTNQAVSAIGWGQTVENGPSSVELRLVDIWIVNHVTCQNRYRESAENGPSSVELRLVDIWIVNHVTCQNRYRALGFEVTDNMVCAGWLDVGVRGQCQGDAGSPLLHNGVVVGIYSWTQGCAEGWFPDLNTLVPPHTAWLVATASA